MPRLECRQLLAELIVHLARDAPPFVLLREDEAGEQLRPRPLGFRLAALGEVEVRADDAHDRSAGFAPDRVAARQDLDVVAVLVAEPELALVRERAARDAVVDLLRPWHVVGVEQPFPRADVRFDLVVGVAEHLLPARRVHDVAGHAGSSPRRLPARRRKPASAAPRFRAATHRRACARRSHAPSRRRRCRSRRSQRARERDLDVADAAVRPDDLFFERRHGVAGQQALEPCPAEPRVRRRGRCGRAACRRARPGRRRRTAGRPPGWRRRAGRSG